MSPQEIPPAPGPEVTLARGAARHGYTMRGEKDQNPPGMSLFALLREDARTHETIFCQGFLAVAVNRLGNWRMSRSRLVRPFFTVLYDFLLHVTLWTARIEVPYITPLGRRVRLWHHGGSVLGCLAIGDDVQIRHNVTMGLANHGDPLTAIPLIEDRVLIGAGACILGPITVGHDSIVAANAVVIHDVPPFSVVGGIPARVLKTLEPVERTTNVRVKAA
jgi:serine O-acetyltransferase